MKRIRLLVSTSLIGCVLTALPAHAQTTASTESTPPVDAETSDEQRLQDIVVTAERRTTTAQKTAASISVRSGDIMALQGRYELSNILEDVPGVVGGAATSTSASAGGGTDNPASGLTIRGIQSNTGSGGSITSTAAAAALYVDDVYNGTGSGYDIDRVEVLRGPQGTLYGRSATAGVVAIHTKNPNTSDIQADGLLEFGNYGLVHFSGGMNVPLIKDKLALRVSGNYYERDGYYSAEGDARSNKALRAKLLWTPTDNFTALLGYAQEYNVTHSDGLFISQTSPTGPFNITRFPEIATAKNNFHQYWANFQLDLGGVAVTYIPAYRTWKQDALLLGRGAFNVNNTIQTPKDNFMTHELRVNNTDGDSSLKWQVGALYYRNALSNTQSLFNLAFNSFQFKTTSDKTTEAIGVFAEATYSFTPTTRLTAGIRFDHTSIENDATYEAFDTFTGTSNTQSLTGAQRLAKFNNLTYKARLEHDLTPRNTIYATISTGFSPGDVTISADATSTPVAIRLDAETLTSYEIGSKNRFLDNRLQINLSGFYYDYSAFQTAGVNITPQLPIQTFQTLSSPLKVYGGEVEVLARPWEGGSLSLNGSYTHARYGEFGAFQYLFSKDTVPNLPAFRWSAALDQRIVLGDSSGSNLVLHGDVRGFSRHDTTSISTDWEAQGAGAFISVPSKVIANLSASLLVGSQFSLTAYVRNVADTRYRPSSWIVRSNDSGPPFFAPIPGSFTGSGGTLSDPRTFGLVATFKY